MSLRSGARRRRRMEWRYGEGRWFTTRDYQHTTRGMGMPVATTRSRPCEKNIGFITITPQLYTPYECRQHSYFCSQRHFAPHRQACTTTQNMNMPFLSREGPCARGRFVPLACNRYRLDLAHADAHSMPTLRCGMDPTIHLSKCAFTSRMVTSNPLAPRYKHRVDRIRSPCETLVRSSSHCLPVSMPSRYLTLHMPVLPPS